MSSALELSPLPRSISLFKIRQIADAGPDSDNSIPSIWLMTSNFTVHPFFLINLIQVLQDGHGLLSLPPAVKQSQASTLTL